MHIFSFLFRLVTILVPFEELHLDEDLVDLMKSVLKNDSRERPSALDLLGQSLIKDGMCVYI